MKDNFTANLQRFQLHFAAQEGNLALVESLIQKKYPVNRFDDLAKTPLHYAVRENHPAIVDRLLRAGANINANNPREAANTPLSDNIEEMSFEMASQLINAGADPTIPGWMQLTALHRATRRKDANAKKILRLLESAPTKQNP